MLNHIGIGEKNGKTRAELVALTGLTDRKVREQIEHLQFQGYWIVNLSNKYYLAETPAELDKYIKRELHRANTILKKLNKMK